MATLTIRVDEATLERLRQQASAHGVSVEEEASCELEGVAPDNLYDAIRRRVEPLGGIELPEISGGERELPNFE